MIILRASIDDAYEILSLQKAAYQSEAELYNNYNIFPLKQTISEIKEQFKDHIFLKAVSEGKIIGTVRAYEKNGTCFIGRLAVCPDMQNQGIGRALMEKIESCFSPERFDFLPAVKVRRIYLFIKN